MKTLIVTIISMSVPSVANAQSPFKKNTVISVPSLVSGECKLKAKRGSRVTAFKFDEKYLFINGKKAATAVYREPVEKERPLMIKYQMNADSGTVTDFRWASLEYDHSGDLEVSIMARVTPSEKPAYRSVCSQKIRVPKN